MHILHLVLYIVLCTICLVSHYTDQVTILPISASFIGTHGSREHLSPRRRRGYYRPAQHVKLGLMPALSGYTFSS